MLFYFPINVLTISVSLKKSERDYCDSKQEKEW